MIFMKKIFQKINKKFLIFFLILMILEVISVFFLFPGTFVLSLFSKIWFWPGVLLLIWFLDTPVDNHLWFQILFFVVSFVGSAAFWTTVFYLIYKLIKKLKSITHRRHCEELGESGDDAI